MSIIEPVLTPVAPAFLRPFFLTIKLEPIKMLEERAKISPRTLSDEFPIRQQQKGKKKKNETVQVLQGQALYQFQFLHPTQTPENSNPNEFLYALFPYLLKSSRHATEL